MEPGQGKRLIYLFPKQSARHGRHTGRKSQEEPSVMVVAMFATILVTSIGEMLFHADYVVC